jgi:hypothetical protein
VENLRGGWDPAGADARQIDAVRIAGVPMVAAMHQRVNVA